jgi:hypothetical protein
VGGVIKALAQQLRLEVAVAPEAEVKLTRLVTFDVAEVTRDELLQAVLRPAGLTFRVNDDELQILPSE